MKRAACYCRVSTVTQAKEGYSLEWQKDNLPLLAKRDGATITDDDMFIEVMSGAKDDRPEYNKLMARIMEGYYQEIWVVEKSRLSRTENRAEEQKIIEALQKFGCLIRTPGMTFDVSSFEGELFNDVDSSFNRYERKRIKYRMQNGKVTKIKQGGYVGGTPPTGYKSAGRDSVTGKVTFEIDETQAQMVKYAYELALAGYTGKGIERKLYEEGYRNSRGNRIYTDSILRWLRNPHYAGFTVSHTRKIKVEENLFLEPLISREDFERVQTLLDQRSKRGTRDKRTRHPLSGILTCGNCGKPFKVDSYRAKVYVCTSKSKGDSCAGDSPKSIYYETAHQMVIDFLPKLIDYVQQYAPQKKRTAQSPKKSKLERLTTQKDSLYSKIMTNIRQQEEAYSEIRKHRIAELEQQYDVIIQAIEDEKKSNVVEMPELGTLKNALNLLEADNVKLIAYLATMVFSKIYFMKRGGWHSHKFEITKIITSWGAVVRVRANGELSFIK